MLKPSVQKMGKKILYIVFNKVAQVDAVKRRFKGDAAIECKTIHACALHAVAGGYDPRQARAIRSSASDGRA